MKLENSSKQSVWPGPEAPKPPHFCRKTPPLAGKFSTPIFTRQIARHYRKKAHFMLFVPFYCIFMSLGSFYMEHLKIILSKIEKNCIWNFLEKIETFPWQPVLMHYNQKKKSAYPKFFTFLNWEKKNYGNFLKKKKNYLRKFDFFCAKREIFFQKSCFLAILLNKNHQSEK